MAAATSTRWRDFIHVSIASRNPSVLVVNPDLRGQDLQGYVDYAKANPGKLAFATSGAGSSNHLLGARLEQVIGAALVHVPYRGAGPAMIDTIAGNVPSMFEFAALGRAAHQGRQGPRAGRQQRGAQPGLSRRADHEGAGLSRPDLLFLVRHLRAGQDAGGRSSTGWRREMQAVLKEPAVVKRWEEIGAEGSTMTPAEVTRFVQAEIDKWTPVVKASGAKPE